MASDKMSLREQARAAAVESARAELASRKARLNEIKVRCEEIRPVAVEWDTLNCERRRLKTEVEAYTGVVKRGGKWRYEDYFHTGGGCLS